MKIFKQKKELIVSLTIFAVAIIFAGSMLTYSYFLSITDNNNRETISTSTGSVSLIFDDHNNGIDAIMNFGDSIKKEFTIKNEGTRDGIVKLSWFDLTNTYLFKSLTYKLTYSESYSETEEGYKIAKTSNDNVPPSSSPSKQELADGLVVPAGKTYHYTLTITLVNLLDTDQSEDLNASLSTRFTIEEGSPTTIKDKMMLSAKKGNPDFSIVSPYPLTYKDGIDFAVSNSLDVIDSFTGMDRKNRYYAYSDSYVFDEETYLYSLVNPKIGKYGDIYNELTNKYVVSASGSDKQNINYTDLESIDVMITPSIDSIYYKRITREALSYDYSDDGVYTMEDDYGTSYYYRGAITNNYVKFGQNEAGEDMFWRIIRLNGDGSMRLIYDGTQGWTNGTSNLNRLVDNNISFNVENDDSKYLGYMYSGTKENEIDSNLKKKIDEWYEKVFKNTKYEKYLQDNIFCNDRSISESNSNYFAARDRVINNTPTLKCKNVADAFTVNEGTKGNGALKYPIGTITVDEAVLAGSTLSYQNKASYLYKGQYYLTISPNAMRTSIEYEYPTIYSLSSTGYLSSAPPTNYRRYAPVINIKSEYLDLFEGAGSASNPYVLNVEE